MTREELTAKVKEEYAQTRGENYIETLALLWFIEGIAPDTPIGEAMQIAYEAQE